MMPISTLVGLIKAVESILKLHRCVRLSWEPFFNVSQVWTKTRIPSLFDEDDPDVTVTRAEHELCALLSVDVSGQKRLGRLTHVQPPQQAFTLCSCGRVRDNGSLKKVTRCGATVSPHRLYGGRRGFDYWSGAGLGKHDPAVICGALTSLGRPSELEQILLLVSKSSNSCISSNVSVCCNSIYLRYIKF